MGFYIRKSISVGPLRFNLSKGGIGVSTGFKGFRIGTGPRGNYVHMGINGIYYRKSFPIQSDLSNSGQDHTYKNNVQDFSTIPAATHSEFSNIETSNYLTLHDASQDDLVKELNEKAKVHAYWVYGLIALFLLDFIYFISGVNLYIAILVNLLSIIGIYYLFILTELNKSTLIMYDFSDEKTANKYDVLVNSIKKMNSSKKMWLVESKAQVYDSKYHAGAGNLIKRKAFSIGKDIDRYIKTNIEVYAVKLDHKVIYFFPDRLILKRNNQYVVVFYKNIDLAIEDYIFIESEGVPSDGIIIDRTWQYVNKKGGPDRRFKNNKELPVVKYELLIMKSNSGLYEQLVFSKLGNSHYFVNAIKNIS